jgi:hypothetical protein
MPSRSTPDDDEAGYMLGLSPELRDRVLARFGLAAPVPATAGCGRGIQPSDAAVAP